MSNEVTMKTLESLYLRISPDKFHFLKFIVEGYDNIALLSSVDSREGIVVLRHSTGHREELFSLLSQVADKLS